jgi:hypothetical protein
LIVQQFSNQIEQFRYIKKADELFVSKDFVLVCFRSKKDGQNMVKHLMNDAEWNNICFGKWEHLRS